MEKLKFTSTISVCQMDELTDEEKHLVELAIEATSRSYAPYSHFSVGAAVRLAKVNNNSAIMCLYVFILTIVSVFQAAKLHIIIK